MGPRRLRSDWSTGGPAARFQRGYRFSRTYDYRHLAAMDWAELGNELQPRTASGTRVSPPGGNDWCLPRFLACETPGWATTRACRRRSKACAGAAGEAA